jgi:1-deoxy-D-xylulose-5-phosphate synthase
MSYLDNIDSREDLLALDYDELGELCGELRSLILDRVSKNGGHLASNLGVVELTVALNRVFDSRSDRIIFDVGHQTYAHKLLTGRTGQFETLRKFGGISGFPKPCESVSDAFCTGHASTSISAGLGMARARTLRGEKYNIISVIGDGALTGGLAYEALNDAGQSREKMIVVLNDNGMSIRRNCGGMSRSLARLRLKPQYANLKSAFRRATDKIPGGKRIYRFVNNSKNLVKKLIIRGSMFEEMGFTYLGPVDGHDIKSLCPFFEIAKDYNAPVLIHIKTDKGKGYKPASDDPAAFHGVGPFDCLTGEPLAESKTAFSEVFGQKLSTLAETDKISVPLRLQCRTVPDSQASRRNFRNAFSTWLSPRVMRLPCHQAWPFAE